MGLMWLRLPCDEVHLWCTSLDEAPRLEIERCGRILSEDERARANRYCVADARTRFLVGRGRLRALLGCYLGLEPDRLRFRYGLWGKPAIAPETGGAWLRFNVAHSHGLALFAVARERAVGVDVEYVRPDLDHDEIARRFFCPREIDALRVVPAARRRELFFACWTRKEAYIKATGEGLARRLDGFEVSLEPGEPPALRQVDGEPREATRWSLAALAPQPGYVGAVAVEGHRWRLVRAGSGWRC